MHPSTRPSVPPRTRRFDNRHVEAKPNQVAKREDKNMNAESSPLSRGTGGPPVSSRLKMPRQGARGPVVQSKTVQPQRNGAHAIPAVSKPKSLHPLSNLGQLEDPNCNEPSLPCLCCDGLSPQDNNSLFNHNHNNNNTVSIRHQMKIPPPPPPQKELHSPNQGNGEDESKPEIKHCNPVSLPIEDREEENGNIGGKKDEDPKNEDINVHVNGNVDVNGNGNCEIEEDGDDSDDEDDDTLVPSGCNCPESMLDSSLTSSTSSSSTSISSCSDLECDYPEAFSLSLQDQEAPEYDISSHSPVFQSNALPLDLNTSAGSPCSSDEGYPSAPWSPSSEYMECKVSEDRKSIKVDLLHFLDSIEDLGKVDLFYRIVKLARWELDGEMVVKDRLDHQQKLQIVNKEAKLAYFLKLQEEGLDLGREDITGLLDEMGNIDIHWKLYKSGKSSDSQEFFDAGVDLTAPSDLDESPAFDSLASSPVEPPSCPPKPPTRHASVQAEPHTYKNIDRHAFSALSINDNNTFSPSVLDPSHLAMPHSSSASRPPFLPPSPGQSVPYFTVNTDKPAPIPPPRRRHKARLEAQRLAELEKEKTPLSLPPPTSRPPPLPPPPLSSFTQAISPPQSLSSPPSFHALDVEIRKLLALAGLTQAELLKLSPELGVCVDVSLETEQQQPDALEIKEIWKNERCEGDIADKQLHYRLREGTRFGQDRQRVETVGEKGESNNGQREAQRTTTFTEMARRRKRNGGNFDYNCSCDFTSIVTQSPSSYYTTSFSHTNIPNLNFEYTSVISETPPPPPPRPLPPCPLKACTLSANASRPDRFDWLIAFTPDTESPPTIRQKASNEGILQKVSTGSKVTTFKELRNKSKQSSPPTLVQPEPDPTVITPDPDFLYNLKWRKEKSDGDGWEYISQAQASFLQPPPTPASLSLFREMCHLNTQEDYSGVHKISKHIDSTISESTHETLSGVDTEKLEDEDKTDVRGTADGAWTLESRTAAVCSFEQTHAAWIREDVRPSLNTEGLSSACLEEKRALVSSVSVAVEAILAQFSSSRTVVQKALSGNSRVNPSLARLVLQCLCPALRSLLCDGLKPHQSDLIAGRRPNSPWGLVQASTKPGPSTQALHSLQSKVAGLSQLKQRRHKFNAFVFGLLNIKLLDYWLSHLLSCADVLGTFYHPTSFMRLSLTCFQPLFEELVLVLQPLSLLTFNLDLLFQHHHLDPSSPALTPASHKFESCSPQDEDPSLHLQTKGLLCGKSHLLGSIHGGWGFDSNPEADLTSQILDVSAYRNPISMSREASPAASWFRENEIPEVAHTESFSQQAGYALQQGWGAVIRFGERLGQNFGLAVGTDDNKSRNTPVDFTTRSPIQNRQQSRQELSLRESGATIPWGLGRLFGASVSSNSLSTNRRPSQWLSPGVSALSRIVNLSQGSQKTDLQQNKKENEQMNETRDQRMPLRAVRALCDHTGTGAELSFRKGEELVLVGGVDHNWIRCRRGHNEGLVPIGYASLIM